MGTSTAYAAMAAALLAALCYAIGAALEQKEASAAATQRVVHPGLLWQVLRRPIWLAGFAVMAVGEVLHVLALAWAPLAVVQPIGVTTVLFALPIGPSSPAAGRGCPNSPPRPSPSPAWPRCSPG